MTTVVYGITANTHKFYSENTCNDELLFVSTNGNEQFLHFNVLSLEQLQQLYLDKININKVVICSQYLSEITTSLINIGISKEIIYFFNHAESQLTPVDSLLSPRVNKREILYVLYDLRTCLPTYDFLNFCVRADIERRIRGKKHLYFIIVPNCSNNATETLLSAFHSPEEVKWRKTKILQGILDCLPNTVGCNFLAYHQQLEELNLLEFEVFPPGALKDPYKSVISTNEFHNLPAETNFSVYRAPPRAVRLVHNYITSKIQSKKLVVLTLREYEIHTDRNSSLSEWANFLSSLDLNIYHPVIVRDTEYCTTELPEPLSQFDSYPLAAIDFPSRVALYQAAWVNLSVSNGPTFVVNYIQHCRAITFMKVDENNPAISSLTFRKAGVEPGEHYSFRDNEFQWLVWQEAISQNIIQCFNEYVKFTEYQEQT